MTNVNDKDVDSGVETDFMNFRIRTKLLGTSSGAGVNAESSAYLAYATADPLSELVWSPHSGLSLKCTNRGEDVRKPFLLWNVGPSSTGPLLERGGGGNGDDHDMIIDKELAESDRQMDKEGEVEREGDSCHPLTVQTDESSKEVAGPLKELESSAENDLHHLTEKEDCGLGGAELPAEGSCMGSRRRGKALSDGDIYRRSSDDEDDSAESSNSAGHTSKGMKGVKRKICDGGVILRSKKMKKQIHGSDGSTFVMKPDSSFMKWISNMMTNGRSDLNNEDSQSPLPLACANDVYSKNSVCFKPRGPAAASISMGFQAVFQSLYCRATDELSTGGEKIVESIEVSREGAVDDGKSPENLHEHTIPIIVGPPSADVDHLAKNTATDGAVHADALGEETKIAAKEVCPNMTAALSKPRTSLWITRLATNTLRSEKGAVDDGKSPENLHEHTIPIIVGSPSADVDHLAKNMALDGEVRADALGEETKIGAKEACPNMTVALSKPRTSLWITRLATNTLRSEKGKETAEETIGCSTDLNSQPNTVSPISDLEASFEVKPVSKLHPVLPSQRFSSEAMASVFARRLDALRHIASCKKGVHLTGSYTCLFCGGCHDVRECSSVTESELEDLSSKLSTPDCSSRKPAVGSCPTFRTWNLNISPSEMQRSSPLKPTKDAEENQRCDIGTLQNTATGRSEMFDAIRNLRLTRADILRWMSSDAPLSHLKGFFLRLRLGNEEGGGSYYVACITGDVSRKSIWVDVGGIKSSVATQYVSNHDFLEDEIKAWWNRSLASGCRIPSLAELNSKFNHRHTLPF